MAIETHQLYKAAAEAIGHKRLASALNVSLQYTYVLAADPLTVEAPARNDVERLTNLIDVLAAHPRARPALHLFRLYFEDVFARTVDKDVPSPLTCEQIIDHVEQISREYADVVAECRRNFDADKIARQGTELIAKVSTLIRCAEAADNTNSGGNSEARRLRAHIRSAS